MLMFNGYKFENITVFPKLISLHNASFFFYESVKQKPRFFNKIYWFNGTNSNCKIL